nr:hypothetical protein [Tanacetum cinerariifolium]
MRIDELHKFSDGMLNDVRNALDDRLKGIQMQLLQPTWMNDKAIFIPPLYYLLFYCRKHQRGMENDDHPLPVVAQVSLAGTAPNAIPTLKDPKFWTTEEKKTQKIDRLQNQGDVNDALGYKKKAVVVTSDPFALVAEKIKVSKRKEKVEVQTESEGSDDEDISYLKKITALLAKAFSRKKFYAKLVHIDSESESEYENLEYYDNSTNYGLFVNDNDDQEIFHDAIEPASENFIENHIDSQKDYDKSKVDYNDSEEKDHLVDKLIRKFNHKIVKCQKRIEKANQQTKDLAIQKKDLQYKYDVLINQVNTFKEQNNEFNEQMKVLNKKNADLLAQIEVLQDQLKVKHVVIDTHTECQAQYTKLKEERYEYMIRNSALCKYDKQHSKKIDEQEILFDKMSRRLVKMNNNVLRFQEKILEK